MEIHVTENAGFCFGIRRAVERVYKEAEKGNVCMYGEITHNKSVMRDLSEKGARVIESLGEAGGDTVVLRAHGVPPGIYSELSEKNIPFIDCTCPCVQKVQRLIKEDYDNGYGIIIAGKKSHPEVIGENGFANHTAIVISDISEILEDLLEAGRRYSLFAQTTFGKLEFAAIANRLSELSPGLKVTDTICAATSDNQLQADVLSRNVDVMLVLGDKNSSNTQKLYGICKKNLEKTYFIETINEIELKNISVSDKIGITAGASTPPAMIKEAYTFMSEAEINSSEPQNQPQSFEEMLDETMVMLHTGDIVTGTVIQVSNGEVLVNLGFKSDGVILKGQFSDDEDADVEALVKPGDKLEVFVVRVNDGDGNVLLSRRRVNEQKGYAELAEAAETGAVLKGKIVEVVKGGVMALINGVRAFVPSSQVSSRFVEDLTTLKGKEFNFNIIQFDKAKKRIVAGRKELAAKEAAEAKDRVFNTLAVGQKVNGTVSRITDFGAFIDLGGVDGLIHISQLSWARVKRVSDVLSIGQDVSVTVLDIDKEKGKISLSLKDVNADPWLNADTKYVAGDLVEGRVVRIVPFGAFVALEEGIDGLVHISQISDKRIAKPEDVLSVGETITARVTEVNLEKKKVSLSIKAVDNYNEPDEYYDEEYEEMPDAEYADELTAGEAEAAEEE